MCGRMVQVLDAELIKEVFGLPETPQLHQSYNVAPTAQIPVIRQDAEHNNRLDFLSWGFLPSWSKDPAKIQINAKSESVSEKPFFRTAIKYRRCLIPSSGFFEWTAEGKGKVPYYITMKDSSPMVYAGIWEQYKYPTGEIQDTVAILTTTPNKLVEPLHDRMPVILHREEYDIWLDRDNHDPEKLKRYYQPYPADMMTAFPVSSVVNNARNDFPECIKPV